MAITAAGKIIVGLVLVCLIYFVAFVLPQMFNGGSIIKITGKTRVKIIAFVKTADAKSESLNKTLIELAKDPKIKQLFTYKIVVVDVEKNTAKKFSITEKEVPCFIIGNEKVVGAKDKNWFEKKILAIAKELNK